MEIFVSKSLLTAVCSILALSAYSTAMADNISMSSDHAPIGVSGDHLHKKNEWMVAYQYRQHSMSGFRDGTKKISTDSVLNAYGEAAIDMQMDMQMLEIMYGVSDNLTLMVMPQYMQMDMTHKSNHGGGHSHTHMVEGVGDTEVSGLYSIYNSNNNKAHLNIGLSLPTGSIDKTFSNHHNVVYNLPYNMQFGSGTFDPVLGATYTGKAKGWSWGAQTINYIRFGKNDNGYHQGNKYTATAWTARSLTDYASLSMRIEGEVLENVSGRDRTLPITTIVGADPDLQAREQIFANLGLNLMTGKNLGILAGHRFAAEVGLPVYRHYSGPQTEADYRFTLGWQKAF